jgi:hypothetical protein
MAWESLGKFFNNFGKNLGFLGRLILRHFLIFRQIFKILRGSSRGRMQEIFTILMYFIFNLLSSPIFFA